MKIELRTDHYRHNNEICIWETHGDYDEDGHVWWAITYRTDQKVPLWMASNIELVGDLPKWLVMA